MAALGLVPSLLWYVPNWAATRAYLHVAFEQQPGTTAHPLALDNLKLFANMLLVSMSWLMAGIALAVLIASVPLLIRTRIRHEGWAEKAYAVSFLGLWFLVPVVAVAVSTNQAPRYCVAAYPAAGAITAVLAMRSKAQAWRWFVGAVAVLVAVTETLQINLAHYRVPGLPHEVSFSTPVGAGGIWFAAEGLPLKTDYTLGMIKYLESVSRGSNGRLQSRNVAILELNGWVNGNNLTYYAAARADPFTFDTLLGLPPDKFAATLRSYDYALYIPQPPAALAASLGRVAQLNSDAGAYEMTPALFALFRPHPAQLYIGPNSGQGNYAQVLVNKSLTSSR
jgi:hypothetical protein